MSARSTASLAVALATGSRRSRRRSMLTAAGIAVAAVFLLGGAAALPLSEARQARVADRTPTLERGMSRSGGALLVRTWTDRYLEQEIAVTEVAALRPDAEVAPGLARLPGPGEIVVSPALRAALAEDPLRERYPQRVVGEVGAAGLRGPREWSVWIGGTADSFPADHPVGSGWGAAPPDVPPVPGALRLAVPVGMAALLLPVLALVVNAVRWGSQERDRRLAALRLSGMSARQVRLLTGLEIGLAAAVGSVLGGVLFLGLRAVLARWLPIDGGGYPLDAAPPLAQAIAIVVGLPLLGTAIAIATLRRVVVNPLGVVRRVVVTRPSGWRFLPLVVGLGVLLWLWATTRGSAEQSAGLLLLVGAVLIMFGLFVTAPAICLGVAAALVRIERSPVLLLAARRAQASAESSARVVGVVSLLVFAASWFLSVLPLTNPTNAETVAQLGRRLQPHTFVSPVAQAPGPDQLALPDVIGVAELVPVQLRSAAAPDGVSVVAADCTALAQVLRAPLPDCTTSTSYLPPEEEGNPLAGGGTFTAFLEGAETAQGIQRVDVGEVRLGQPVRGALDGLGDLAMGAAIVPRSQVPDEALRAATSRTLLVSTSGEGGPVARERVRTAIQALQQGSLREVRDVEELAADANAVGLGYQAVVWAGLGLAFVVSALSLAVALLDRLIEERRGIASLRAQGVTVPTLRLAMLGQTVLTLLPGALAGMAAAVPLALVFFAVSGHPELSVPWSGLAATAVGCGLATLGVVALLLPSLNEVVDTGQLVAE